MANMTGGTGGTMATFTQEVWSKLPSVTYRAEVVIANLLDRRWEPELKGKGKGDLANIPNFSQNSGAVARGTFGTAAGLSSELIATTESQTQLVVNKMALYGYSQPHEAQVQAMTIYEALLLQGIGTSLALYLDGQLAGDNSNGFDAFSTVVGTDNVDITEEDLITCMTNLNNVNAKLEGRALVVSPASYASLLIQGDRILNQLYSKSIGAVDANKAQGHVGGPVYTFPVWVSNNLEAGSSGKKNAAFQKEAIALAVQEDVTIHREPSVIDGVIEYVVGTIIFGHKEVKDTSGIELDGK